MKYELEAIDPMVTGESIKDIESRVGNILPSDYVDFLHQCNGARIPKSWRKKDQATLSIQYFMPVSSGRISSDKLSDSLGVYNTLSDGRLPPWFAPIARDGIGGVYCLSTRSSDFGKVYVVYVDDDQDDVPYEKREYALIASSFTDFYQQVIGNYVQ